MPRNEPATPLALRLDDALVQAHLRRVEHWLRPRDVSALPEAARLNRVRCLDHLREYWQRGQFPRNHDRPGRVPCFIDRDGRACAVAHLMIESGQGEVARRIAQTANNAFVEEMRFPELGAWAAQAGFSREELALIQPDYSYRPDAELVMFIHTLPDMLRFALTMVGMGTLVFGGNAVNVLRGRPGRLMPVLGVVAGIVLLCLGIALTFSIGRGNALVASSQHLGQEWERLGCSSPGCVQRLAQLEQAWEWWGQLALELPRYVAASLIVGLACVGIGVWNLTAGRATARSRLVSDWRMCNTVLLGLAFFTLLVAQISVMSSIVEMLMAAPHIPHYSLIDQRATSAVRTLCARGAAIRACEDERATLAAATMRAAVHGTPVPGRPTRTPYVTRTSTPTPAATDTAPAPTDTAPAAVATPEARWLG
jgi:hypothetical protein